MIAGGVLINRSPLPRRNHRIAGGGKSLGLESPAHLSKPIGGARGDGKLPRVSGGAVHLKLGADHRPGEDLDHPSQSVVSVDRRSASRHDFDPLDTDPRDLAPVEPSAERIIAGHAIEENQASGNAGWTDPAQVDSLRGRVGDEAAGSPKSRKGGQGAQQLVDGLSRALCDFTPR